MVMEKTRRAGLNWQRLARASGSGAGLLAVTSSPRHPAPPDRPLRVVTSGHEIALAIKIRGATRRRRTRPGESRKPVPAGVGTS